MLYIFHGEDDFSRREALIKLKASLGPPEILSTNTTVLEGAELTLEELMAICNTVPFLAEHRLVIAQGLLGRYERRESRGRRRAAGRQQKTEDLGEWSDTPEAIRNLPSTTALVLTDGPLGRDNPLLRLLVPLGQVKEFPSPRGQRLQRWIQERVIHSGGTISPGAIRLLAEYAGRSLWALAEEIDKLSLYANGRTIEEEDVRKLVASARDPNIFALVDAVIEGDPSKASRELHQLLRDGATSSYILAMLARQLRLLAISRDLMQRGVPGRELGSRLGVTSEYALSKILDQSGLYDLAKVTDAYERILNTDLAFKTGEVPETLALELLVVELAGPRSE